MTVMRMFEVTCDKLIVVCVRACGTCVKLFKNVRRAEHCCRFCPVIVLGIQMPEYNTANATILSLPCHVLQNILYLCLSTTYL